MASLPVEVAAWIIATALAAWTLEQPWWTLILAPIIVLIIAALATTDA